MSSTTPPSNAIDDLFRKFPTLVTEVEKHDPMYQIWWSAWHEPDKMFGEIDGYAVLHICPPQTQTKQIFVRPEYVQAYEDARRLYEGVVQRSVGKMMEFATPDGASTFTLARTTENLHKRDLHPALKRMSRAMIITGHPGIGKTASLWYYLVRRLAIHEMVVYQDEPSCFFIFHDRGVAMVEITAQVRPGIMNSLPFSTWCLVDSNKRLVDPGNLIVVTRRFLIQAASLNAAKSQWETKAAIVSQRYIMKPMSLEELEFVSRCQEDHTPLTEVRNFYNNYGPSVWGALFRSDLDWKNDLEQAFGSLAGSLTQLNTVIKELNKIADNHPSISSKVFLISPGQKRHIPQVKTITDHVERQFVDWARKEWGDNSRAFYDMLLYGPSEALGLADSFLKNYMHAALVDGRVYLLTELSQFGGTRTWSAPSKDLHQLILPDSTTTFCIQHTVDPSASHDDSNIILPKEYGRESPELKDYVYYKPISKTQATIDSFVYSHRSNTILAFQITVAARHPLKRSDLQWLKSLRSHNSSDSPTIFLVGVSVNNDMHFACKDGAEEDIAKFYHLKLQDLPSLRKPSKQEVEPAMMEGIEGAS